MTCMGTMLVLAIMLAPPHTEETNYGRHTPPRRLPMPRGNTSG